MSFREELKEILVILVRDVGKQADSPDPTRFSSNPYDQALTEILEAVKEIVPEENHSTERYSTTSIDRMTFDQGFNTCRQEILNTLEKQ